jgi:hypothetical protein
MTKVNPTELHTYLEGMNYPASKQELIAKAQEHGADDEMYKLLAQLTDQQYDTFDQVIDALEHPN